MKASQGRRRVAAASLVLLLLVTRLVGALPVAAQGTSDLPGVIADGEYKSPQFSTQVTWTDAWAIGDVNDPNVAHAIGGYATEPVVSDPATGDVLWLTDRDSGTAVITLSIAATGVSLNDLVDHMQTDAYLEQNLFMEPGAEVLSFETKGDSVGMLVRDTGSHSDHALYIAVTVPRNADEPTIAVAIDLFDPGTYKASIDALANDLTIDGYDVFATQSQNDVLDLLGSSNGGGAVPPATPEATRASAGGSTLSADEYLKAVRDDTDLRATQLDRLQTLLFSGSNPTAAESREIEKILNDWVDMQPIEAPQGFAEIDDEHRALVKNLNALGTSLLNLATGNLSSEEQDKAVSLAGGALRTSLALIKELDTLLSDQGV